VKQDLTDCPAGGWRPLSRTGQIAVVVARADI